MICCTMGNKEIHIYFVTPFCYVIRQTVVTSQLYVVEQTGVYGENHYCKSLKYGVNIK